MDLIYKTEPWEHQRKYLEFLMPRDNGAIFLGMGSGKSKIIVDLIVNRKFKTVLILAPKRACKIWPKQFSIHSDKACDVLDVSKVKGKGKVQAINNS